MADPSISAGSIEEMKNQAHELGLGLVLDDETIDSGVKLTDTMDHIQLVATAQLDYRSTDFYRRLLLLETISF